MCVGKLHQPLQVLRDAGLLLHPERARWRLRDCRPTMMQLLRLAGRFTSPR